MLLSLVAAASENNVIGNKGKLPWRLPADLRHFQELTEGHPVIMGRKTYESIGHPLPRRQNIVITKQEGLAIPGCTVVHSLEEALESIRTRTRTPARDEVFVIGGGEIYREALPVAHRIYLTRVHAHIEGDTFFPGVNWNEWKEVSREQHKADAENPHPYTFLIYERKEVL